MIDLRLGDCLELMPQLESQSFDAIIADIPYGTTACKWDTVIPFEPMWAELKRLAKPKAAIVLFGSQPFTSALVMSNPKMFRYEWCWYKNRATGIALCKYQPMRCKEDILVFSLETSIFNPQRTRSFVTDRKFTKKNGGGVSGAHSNHYPFAKGRQASLNEFVNPRNVIEFDTIPSATGYLHPTQKPVALMEYLIRTYTNEGDTVLDFTMGSGTTMVACVNTNRNGVGVEKDPKYFEIAKRRVQEAQAQMVMPMVSA